MKNTILVFVALGVGCLVACSGGGSSTPATGDNSGGGNAVSADPLPVNERRREIVADYPDTPEAKEAAELLEGIGEK